MESTADIPHADPVPWWWKCAVVASAAVWVVLYLPYALGLQPYFMFDSGWALSTNAILKDGLIPTRDFAYIYGLLTLSIDRVWFAVFGATPQAQAALSLVCVAAVTWATIQFATAMRLRFAGRLLLLGYAPLAIIPWFFPTPAHALEAALLANAIALQARGRNAAALVLVTTCLFVKPALAAVYGPILVGLILFAPGQHSWRSRFMKLLPAIATGIAIVVLLTWQYGIAPLIATLLPTEAGKIYKAEDYGFFSAIGQSFWLPNLDNGLYSPFAPAGFWVLGTIVVVVGAVRAFRQGRGIPAAVVITCVALHLVFIFLVFGNASSWKYYTYILGFAIAATIDRAGLPDGDSKPASNRIAIWLTVLAVMCQADQLLICVSIFPSAAPPTETAGLYASPDDTAFWIHVREIAKRERVLVLCPVSAAHEIFPEVDSPRVWCLVHQVLRPEEVTRVRAQIQAADVLVIPLGQTQIAEWPEFKPDCQVFQVVEKHPTFHLARRIKR